MTEEKDWNKKHGMLAEMLQEVNKEYIEELEKELKGNLKISDEEIENFREVCLDLNSPWESKVGKKLELAILQLVDDRKREVMLRHYKGQEKLYKIADSLSMDMLLISDIKKSAFDQIAGKIQQSKEKTDRLFVRLQLALRKIPEKKN